MLVLRVTQRGVPVDCPDATRADPRRHRLARAGRRFRETGARITPLADTVARTAHDERERRLDRPRRAGLTAAEELEVLAGLPS